MSFTSLTESQIVANLIDTYTSLTTSVDDMNVGSNIRSLFEAFAQELRRLYQNTQENAAETQRTAAYAMFNFPLLLAQAAYTMETFTVTLAPSVDVTVPTGTTVGVSGTSIQYKTVTASTWSAGSTSMQIRVVCTQTGSIGNRRSGEINQLITPISGLAGVVVTNSLDVRTGSDLETDDQRANRFSQWINSLHSGDLRALAYGAKTAQLLDQYGYISEQVVKSQVVEGTGSNTLYIDNGYYSTSSNLVSQCQTIINGYKDANGNLVRGYKAAGIPTTVQTATYSLVTLAAKISPQTGYTFPMIQQSVISSISDLVQSLDIGDSLTINAINLAIGNTPGVLNFQVTAPTADIVPAAGSLLQLGAGQPYITSM